MSRNIFQDVFLLSFASNLASNFKGTETDLQKALQDALNVFLDQVPGWQVVWGPVVWKNKPDEATTGPENAWYVAYHPSLRFQDGTVHPTYLVSIAGTPPESEYVWLCENFAVHSVADFNVWVANGIQNKPQVVRAKDIVPGTPYIATGTVNAVHLLLTTPAPDGAANPGTTLPGFLADVGPSDDTRFIVTGHSLGGALAPSLALALVSSGVIPAHSTLTYGSAGASPGNNAFAKLFEATFPPLESGENSYEGWNSNWINTLDIVPQAWSILKVVSPKQNLTNIPTIFGEPAARGVRGITLVFAFVAYLSGIYYHPLPSRSFSRPLPPVVPKDWKEFLEVALPEHIVAYFEEIGIPLPVVDKSRMIAFGLTEKTEDEKRFNHPVIAEIEWGRENPKEAEKIIHEVEDKGAPDGM